MNKLLLFSIILTLGSFASAGFLGVNFDMIAQALGVFSTADVELLGCDCVDSAGNTVDCDDTNVVVTDDPLCPTSPANMP
jgi:hypothetical protein